MKLKVSTRPKIDYKDLQIIEGLSKYTPRNILKISREIGIPESTIRYRIRTLIKRGVLRLYTNVYHTNIGLKKHVVFTKYNPIYKDDIYNLINAYSPIYMLKVYSGAIGSFSVHIIPPNLSNDLEKYFKELVKLDVIHDYKVYHSTCFHNINPITDWFDIISGNWIFGWDTLIEDIQDEESKLPITLKDPNDFPILADRLDINILRLLELDPTITYTAIAKKLDTTPQNIKYHYEEHIVKNFLIEDFDIQIRRFNPRTSTLVIGLLNFTSMDMLAKAANAFERRAFSEILGKILGRESLLGIFYLPNNELWRLVDSLNDMVKVGILKYYEVFFSPLSERGKAYTIPYQYFADDHWMFPSLDYYLERLYSRLESIRLN